MRGEVDPRLRILFERRSVRRFRKEEIPEEDLMKMLEAANFAPSAGNLQARDFIVIKDEENKRKVAEIAYGQYFIAEAPVVVVICANYGISMSRYGKRGEVYALQDADAATQNLLLAAHALGYGAVWIGAFDEEKLSELLDLPPYVRPTAIVPIGKPAEKPRFPGREEISKKIHLEKWRPFSPFSSQKLFWKNHKISRQLRS